MKFEGLKTHPELLKTGCTDVPDKPGIYVVRRRSLDRPEFMITNNCYPRKGQISPTKSKDYLCKQWIDGTRILYIGRAKRTLHDRITDYVRSGTGLPPLKDNPRREHWGGRLIWQLQDWDQLLFSWRCESDPGSTEDRLFGLFKQKHGKLPFANLRR